MTVQSSKRYNLWHFRQTTYFVNREQSIVVFRSIYTEEGSATANFATNWEKCPKTLKKTQRNLRRASMMASDIKYLACKSMRNPVNHKTSERMEESVDAW